jgi:hypothetical protein
VLCAQTVTRKSTLFLKEELFVSFSSQAARGSINEGTPCSECSFDHTIHFLIAAWNTGRSCQEQIRTHGGKCPFTTTTHHPQAAGETANMYKEGSNAPCAFSKGCSSLEANDSHYSARNAAALASRALPSVLEAQVKGLFSQAQGRRGNHRID